MSSRSKHLSGLKLPVRPAPAPPPGPPFQKSSTTLMDSWESFDDSFESFPKGGSTKPAAWPDLQTQKKVPPPRPPPPKIALSKPGGKSGGKHSTKSNSKQASRPTELLSNLFSRRGQKGESIHSQGSKGFSNPNTPFPFTPVSSAVATASLIDLSSPPSSPTPTTRSSSDGLSVDSFGSDGTTSHSHHHSQVESGFEDDSDLFGGFTATPSPVNRDPWSTYPSTPNDVFSPISTSTAPSKNPWSSAPQDPFSPPRKFTASPTSAPVVSTSTTATAPAPGVMAFKPTIIRPKIKPGGSPSVSRAKTTASPLPYMLNDDCSESPPMPSIPPPAPPTELLSEADVLSSTMGSLKIESKKQGPHCQALFDYESSHPDDLPFKEGDKIDLIKEVGEWFRGRLGNREGIFPASFVKVVIPLPDAKAVFATALYSFTPETWEDLELQEGAQVQLLARIDNDWLYGECNGKQGQFPATFVDNVPSNLPMRS
ncbi:SH3 domain-containing protein 19 [Frankliniella fusca]|uniref:SH3 domain-containing protein 19 n=1 Tax=Frankliniella fusca TaxID=407009 RepID=A0AAE1H0N4_9NEOP|nr:SH3 domain-containing protein 19 [Frankliniella fusca]